jgi:hypothetical protein
MNTRGLSNNKKERERERECKSVIWGEKKLDICDEGIIIMNS